MNYTLQIKEEILKTPPKRLIFVSNLWQEKYHHIPETAFFKAIERLNTTGEIARVAKGIYCIPENTQLGKIIASEEQLINHYVGENCDKGIQIGYALYQRKKLTTQISKTLEFLTINMKENRRIIGNIKLHKIDMIISKDTRNVVEALEIIQNYSAIQDINYVEMVNFCENVSKNHNDSAFNLVCKSISYKKCTIASYKGILDYYGVKNELNLLLSPLSNYSLLSMENLNELAFRQKNIY